MTTASSNLSDEGSTSPNPPGSIAMRSPAAAEPKEYRIRHFLNATIQYLTICSIYREENGKGDLYDVGKYIDSDHKILASYEGGGHILNAGLDLLKRSLVPR
ncbi:hypothetical protein F25303_2147 [Fusarium sp. NRRL 25303]|nr:hypothetical protein F25303_2147 [Fusarium sp. NRRL 25303]